MISTREHEKHNRVEKTNFIEIHTILVQPRRSPPSLPLLIETKIGSLQLKNLRNEIGKWQSALTL
jgi:hypothetical protein